MKDELSLIENLTDLQLEKIIYRKAKGKMVLFRDLIDKVPYESVDL